MEKNIISVERTSIPQMKPIRSNKVSSYYQNSLMSQVQFFQWQAIYDSKLKKEGSNLFWYVLNHFFKNKIKNNNLIMF